MQPKTYALWGIPHELGVWTPVDFLHVRGSVWWLADLPLPPSNWILLSIHGKPENEEIEEFLKLHWWRLPTFPGGWIQLPPTQSLEIKG